MKILLYVLAGAIFLFPIISRAPVLGWDWYYFYHANNPDFNLYSAQSAYPPFAKYFIQLFTWMDWRTSLGWLNSITVMTAALAVWKNGGRYLQIIAALASPPLWFLLWIGHVEGLVLTGIIIGFVPLLLIKPILSIFSVLSDRKLAAWTFVFLAASFVIWPSWVNSFRFAVFGHVAAFGWADTGWPILVLGVVLLLGAGSNPYRLMATGCFITPYLMPYHLYLLIPALGKLRGWRLVAVWGASFSLVLGTGLTGIWHLLSYVFPVAVYCTCDPSSNYWMNLKNLAGQARSIILFFRLQRFGRKADQAGSLARRPL